MLNLIAVFLVCSGIGIAVHIAIDLTHRPQSMKIMNAVWILTALWGSYLALWAYNKFGQGAPMKMGCCEMKMDMSGMKDMNMDMSMGDMSMKHPHWQSVALSALHCGAGCTLADIIGEWFTNYIPVTVAGSQLIGNWVLDFILALIIGVYFQFYAIREMERISVGKVLSRAFKADFFSLLSWQIGMYGWMAIVYFVLFVNEPLPKDTWIFCKSMENKVKVIEYTELPEKMAEEIDSNGQLMYGEVNILSHLFNIKALEKLSEVDLPYHTAYKKSNYLDEKGNFVEVTTPNAYK